MSMLHAVTHTAHCMSCLCLQPMLTVDVFVEFATTIWQADWARLVQQDQAAHCGTRTRHCAAGRTCIWR